MDNENAKSIITEVLLEAKAGKGSHPCFLSAYQILAQFPDMERTALIEKHGDTGKGAGKHYSAATHIAKLASGMEGIEIVYVDTTGMKFTVGNKDIEPGYEVCAFFRLT